MLSVNDLIAENLKDEEFATLFEEQEMKNESAVALLNFREEMGFSQQELAKMSGKSQSTISNMEQGKLSSFDVFGDLITAMGGKYKIVIETPEGEIVQ